MITLPQILAELSAVETWKAFQDSLQEAARLAGTDYDVSVEIDGCRYLKVAFWKPNTFVFSKPMEAGDPPFIICTAGSFLARIVVTPRVEPQRRILGFSAV
jgi:hypothetical protein